MAAVLTKAALDVGLVTDNAERALHFYRDILGFPEDGEVQFPGVGLIKRLRCGESILRIIVADTSPLHRASTEGMLSQTGLRYLTLAVSNVDQLVQEVEEAGFPVPLRPREIRPGVRVAQIEDGQGTTIELMQIGR